jgi:phosphotransferase system enzyme I (PtsI)
MKELKGAGASVGVVVGPVFIISDEQGEIPELDSPVDAIRQASNDVRDQLVELSAAAAELGRTEPAEILNAQSLMAEDPMLIDEVESRLSDGMSLGDALHGARDQVADMLASMNDEYLAARAHDVREVADRIFRHLSGVTAQGLSDMTTPAVVVASALTAAETATMDVDFVLGFAAAEGGPTGHVAVIARSLGIPAVVGTVNLMEVVAAGDVVGINGSSGRVAVNPSEQVVLEFESDRLKYEAQKRAAALYKGRPVTFGNRPIAIAANVASGPDIATAVAAQSDGVGLYRTEFLFLDGDSAPTEDEQYVLYRAAVEAFEDTVVVRTFDIGGDKPAPYLELPEEENPFLGVRGVRLYDQFAELFQSQARALLRASVHGKLSVMIPMVGTVDDLTGARHHFDVARTRLASEGVPYGDIKLGVMIEVPSAALNAKQLAQTADFFSIGTNDLTQYTMAADRTAGALAHYSDAAHPAVLRLCKIAAKAANKRGITISVCGESAADPVTALLFAAMGIHKLSVSPMAVDMVRSTIDNADADVVKDLLKRALKANSAGEVRQIMAPVI